MKKHVLLLALILGTFSIFSQEVLSEKMNMLHRSAPQEKLYLMTDHTVYQPGETIFFKAWLTGAPGANSFFVYVQLMDPQGKMTGSVILCQNGIEMSDGIAIPADAPGGVYTLKAFTQWMRNFGDDAFFEKKLLVQQVNRSKLRLRLEVERTHYQPGDQVLAMLEAGTADNEPIANTGVKVTAAFGGQNLDSQVFTTDGSGKVTIAIQLPRQLPPGDGLLQVAVSHGGVTETAARAIPLRQRKIRLEFLPEGGDLTFGWVNNIAFKATDDLDNPLDFRGRLYNNRGEVLLPFASFHDGMGALELEPKEGERYYALLDGQADTFWLPAAIRADFALRAWRQEGSKVRSEVRALRQGKAYLALRMNDSLFWQKTLEVQPGVQRFDIPVASLPAGIAQLTLFDEQLLPWSERLLFINPQRTVSLEILTDKEQYLPGEMAGVNVWAKDETGQFVSGDFAVTVVEDRLWAQINDRQDNILSRLLLTSELRGYIDEPAFYFDSSREKASEALDLVMLTHGWRHFAWKDVLKMKEKELEMRMPFRQSSKFIDGFVYLSNAGRCKGVKVWIPGTDRDTVTDENGRFTLHADGLTFPVEVKARVRRRENTIQVQSPSRVAEAPPVPPAKVEGLGLQLKALENEVEVVATVQENSAVENSASLTSLASNMSLDEVVVVGYSVSTERKELGYSTIAYQNNPAQWDVTPGMGDNIYLGNAITDINLTPHIWQDFASHYRYYNRRRFYVPSRRSTAAGVSQDVRKTVHWEPNLRVSNGKAAFSFKTTDEVSTFRIIVEGLAGDGVPGRSEHTFYTQKIISMEADLPGSVTFGDTLTASLRVFNRSSVALEGKLKMEVSEKAFHLLDDSDGEWPVTVPAGSTQTLQIPLTVGNWQGEAIMTFFLLSGEQSEQSAVAGRTVKVLAKGFLKELYVSEKAAEKTFTFEVNDVIPGTLEASFTAYPHVLAEMTEGLASIVREPYGCFEQVSSSNYPNILALKLMQVTRFPDLVFQKKAKKFLDTGYRKLSGYETPEGGFSLYGKNPPNLRLTAYGLLQFHDMKEVYDGVSESMLARTLDWLLKQRDPTTKRFQADGLTNLFTFYVLSELRLRGVFFEKNSFEEGLAQYDSAAATTSDPYFLAMVACANLNAGRQVGSEQQIRLLLSMLNRQTPGNFEVKETFSLSYGKSMQVETAAWAALALLKAGKTDEPVLLRLIDFIQHSRSGYGGYGSTQGTVMALKALKAWYLAERSAPASGQFVVDINGHQESMAFSEKTYGRLWIDLAPHFRPGRNVIKVRQSVNGDLRPFTVQANWRSLTLPASENAPLSLRTNLSAKASVGDFVRMEVEIHNETTDTVAAPLAIIHIPAGLSLQSWQLRDLEQQGVFDFFEIKDNALVAYYEKMPPGNSRRFQLDLKAETAGHYQSPASLVYPYYTSELRYWLAGETIDIR